jgi:diguanylate cyclase (GGDEF)-like protein
MQTTHDTSASAPMTSIVRIAVIVVTLALFLGSTLNAVTGQRDLAVLFALATPLGISAWGFARAGHNEAAVVLLCCVLITVVTLVLVLNPLGVNNIAVTAYGGVMLFGALLLSRRAFYALATLTLVGASTAFVMDINGLTRSQIGLHTGWPQFLEFLVITGVFAVLGRYGAEVLFGSLGDTHRATVDDPVTGLLNRPGFLDQADRRLKAARGTDGCNVLVLADLDGFRRVNVVIGHRAGDGVLKETAGRLTRLAQAHLRGRIGDDEFALLAMGLSDEAAAEAFARSVHEALQFEFAGVSVRASVGFARSPRDADGAEGLLLAAEGSLTRAKDHENESERFAAPADRI